MNRIDLVGNLRQQLVDIRMGDCWWPYQFRADCFCALFGTSRRSCARIAAYAVLGYLPVFQVRQQNHFQVSKFIEQIHISIKTDRILESPLDNKPTDGIVDEDQYLRAVRTLELLVTGDDPGFPLVATITEYVIWGCISQKIHNVWKADDPIAYHAEKEFLFTLTEQPMDEIHHAGTVARREALSALLVGRTDQENISARAVAWREWAEVAGWLEELALVHPEYDEDAAAEALKRNPPGRVFLDDLV
jgi:hypothetical protein